MSKVSIAAAISRGLQAMANCEHSGNTEWLPKHRERVLAIVKATAPSGSGIDCGTELDLENSTSERLVFTLSFHHMNEHGSYDGWSNHEIVVKSSLAFGLDVKVKGQNRNDVKDYLHEVYAEWLRTEIDEFTGA